jgi:hypothetical protein
MRISKSVMAVGGVVLAAALIWFTNPKTVHAVAAALVQVTNTASNPVVTQSVGAQADNLVRLACPLEISSNQVCEILLPNGDVGGGPYSVPPGQTLIVTGVDVTPLRLANQCPGPYVIDIFRLNAGSVFFDVSVPISQVTTQFRYSPGLAIGEGALIASVSQSTALICSAEVDVRVYGYLTPAVAPPLRLPLP